MFWKIQIKNQNIFYYETIEILTFMCIYLNKTDIRGEGGGQVGQISRGLEVRRLSKIYIDSK